VVVPPSRESRDPEDSRGSTRERDRVSGGREFSEEVGQRGGKQQRSRLSGAADPDSGDMILAPTLESTLAAFKAVAGGPPSLFGASEGAAWRAAAAMAPELSDEDRRVRRESRWVAIALVALGAIFIALLVVLDAVVSRWTGVKISQLLLIVIGWSIIGPVLKDLWASRLIHRAMRRMPREDISKSRGGVQPNRG
jgi:hypothetical protein